MPPPRSPSSYLAWIWLGLGFLGAPPQLGAGRVSLSSSLPKRSRPSNPTPSRSEASETKPTRPAAELLLEPGDYQPRVQPEDFPFFPSTLSLLARAKETQLSLTLYSSTRLVEDSARGTPADFERARLQAILKLFAGAIAKHLPKFRWEELPSQDLAPNRRYEEATSTQDLVFQIPGRRWVVPTQDLLRRRTRNLTWYFYGESLLDRILRSWLERDQPAVRLLGAPDASLAWLAPHLSAEGYRISSSDPPEAADVLVWLPAQEGTSTKERALRAEFLQSHVQAGRPLLLGLSQTEERNPGPEIYRKLGLRADLNWMARAGDTWSPREVHASPKFFEHAITRGLSREGLFLALPEPMGLEPDRDTTERVDIRTLVPGDLSSHGERSRQGPARVDPGDLLAPLSLAVAISSREGSNNGDQAPLPEEFRAVVVGSTQFLDPSFLHQHPGNLAFLLASLRWLRRLPPKAALPPRPISELLR